MTISLWQYSQLHHSARSGVSGQAQWGNTSKYKYTLFPFIFPSHHNSEAVHHGTYPSDTSNRSDPNTMEPIQVIRRIDPIQTFLSLPFYLPTPPHFGNSKSWNLRQVISRISSIPIFLRLPLYLPSQSIIWKQYISESFPSDTSSPIQEFLGLSLYLLISA